jgi:hypothetical protein
MRLHSISPWPDSRCRSTFVNGDLWKLLNEEIQGSIFQ